MRVPAAGIVAAAMLVGVSAQSRLPVGDRVRALSRASVWRLVASVPVAFPTHHPQGMVKVGDAFIVSSVAVTSPTARYAAPQDGYDRSAGAGVGHLFKIDSQGRLIGHVTLGEGALYHPGGIDYDGRNIWVPVAEYRPDSRSILYRVDPATLKPTEVLRVADHIGGIVHNTDDRTLHAVTWGSRRFYRWTLDADGRVTNGTAPLSTVRTLNPSHYVDYQDCKYAGSRQMLCTGIADLRSSPEAPPFRLGGIDLVSLVDGRPVHQVPLSLSTTSGRPMTQNPAWIEPTATGLRGYFMPEDDASTIYVYDVDAR